MLSSTRFRSSVEIARQVRLANDMSKLQESISSGKRISTPSDDPIASSRVSEIRQAQADHVVYLRNITTGSALAAEADGKLQAVATIIDRAKDLLLQARNQATSDADRASLAVELRGLAEDVDSYSQETDSTGRPIFPTGTTLAIPVSETLSYSPTDLREDIFDRVPTAGGPMSIRSILDSAATQMQQTDTTQRDTDLSTMLDTLDVVAGHVADARAGQGIRAARFDDAKESIKNTNLSLTEERSDLESTDLTYAISAFKTKEVALQAAQAVFAQTNRKSLFDLIG